MSIDHEGGKEPKAEGLGVTSVRRIRLEVARMEVSGAVVTYPDPVLFHLYIFLCFITATSVSLHSAPVDLQDERGFESRPEVLCCLRPSTCDAVLGAEALCCVSLKRDISRR